MSNSSDTVGTQITDSLNFIHDSTSTKKSIAGTSWTVDSKYYNNFFNSNLILRIVRTFLTSGTSRIYYGGTINNTEKGLLTCTITYIEPSLIAPSNLVISQHETNGTYTLSWDAAIGTNGTGDITYQVWSASDQEPLTDEITATSYTANIPGYDYYFEYRVYAYYSGLTKSSDIVGSYFNPPSVSAVTLSLAPESGDSTTLIWSNPTISYGTASKYDYTIQYTTGQASDIEYITITNQDTGIQNFAIPSSWFEDNIEDGESVAFNIVATAYIDSYVADSSYNTLTTITDYIFFTYDGKYTIGYYDGTAWKECIIYYYDGANWIECIPHYYDGSEWKLIKTKV